MSTPTASVAPSVPAPTAQVTRDRFNLGLGLARIVIGVLWLTQVVWKLPPTFGCPTPFAFSTQQHFTTGLCDWIGREAAYAGNLHIFTFDLHLVGGNFSLDLSPLSSAYGHFISGFVIPNFSWMAWLIFGMELFIAVTVLLGVFGRLGALIGTLQALNLMIGTVPIPGEWEWTDILLIVANFMLLVTAANRSIGLDGWLHPRFVANAAKGSKLARVLAWFT